MLFHRPTNYRDPDFFEVMSIMSDVFSLHEEEDDIDCELEKNPIVNAKKKFERYCAWEHLELVF